MERESDFHQLNSSHISTAGNAGARLVPRSRGYRYNSFGRYLLVIAIDEMNHLPTKVLSQECLYEEN